MIPALLRVPAVLVALAVPASAADPAATPSSGHRLGTDVVPVFQASIVALRV